MCYENDNYNKKDESWSCIKRVSRTRNSNIQLWICGQFNVLLLLHCGYVVLIIDINHIVSPSFVCSSHDYHKHEQNNHLISSWKLIVCHCNSIQSSSFILSCLSSRKEFIFLFLRNISKICLNIIFLHSIISAKFHLQSS